MTSHKRQILKFFLNFFILPVGIYLSITFYHIVRIEKIESRASQTSSVETSGAEIEPPVYAPPVTRPNPSSTVLGTQTQPPTTSFASLNRVGPPLTVEPVNREASIIIEKIGVNTPIVWDVTVKDRAAYNQALNAGVAHAQGTDKPGREAGNTYLFAHSTRFEQNIAHYAAVFTKLDELNLGDRVVILYEGKRYDYEVEEIAVVPSFDTTPLVRSFDVPKLTLQTCYPRGIPKDRLIVTAKLVGVFEE